MTAIRISELKISNFIKTYGKDISKSQAKKKGKDGGSICRQT
jgi:hypothetical protein